jgi:hypothetical protein
MATLTRGVRESGNSLHGREPTGWRTTGFTAAAAPRLKQGDVLTFNGVNSVNPQSRANRRNHQIKRPLTPVHPATIVLRKSNCLEKA